MDRHPFGSPMLLPPASRARMHGVTRGSAAFGNSVLRGQLKPGAREWFRHLSGKPANAETRR